jgi:sugar transferase (PEP-CTERM system associated)
MLRLFKQYYPIRNVFFVLGEGIFIFVSVLLAAIILSGSSALHEEPWFYVKLITITIICQVCLYYNNHYELKSTNGVQELALRLIQSLGFTAIFLSLLYIALPIFTIGFSTFMMGAIIVVVLVACWRFAYALVLSRGIFNQQIILLGSSDLIKKIRSEIDQRKDCGYTVAVEVPECTDDPVLDAKKGGQAFCQNIYMGLYELSQSYSIDKIVVAYKEKRKQLPMDELLQCRVEGIEIIEGNSFYEMLTGKLLVELINPAWLIFSAGFQKSRIRRLVKRTTDLILSVVAIILLTPLFILVSIAIKLDSPGPVVFSQERVGERRRIYRIYKFRSMVQDAEKLSGPKWAEVNDSRITRVGRIIRRLRIDELPQVLNVLKGEMSFVGPRPEREVFVNDLEKIVPYYRERFTVKPGMSGWAQVNYGYGASVADAVEKLNYDLFYIKNMSNMMDLVIIMRTAKIVFFGYGAR